MKKLNTKFGKIIVDLLECKMMTYGFSVQNVSHKYGGADLIINGHQVEVKASAKLRYTKNKKYYSYYIYKNQMKLMDVLVCYGGEDFCFWVIPKKVVKKHCNPNALGNYSFSMEPVLWDEYLEAWEHLWEVTP